jgi:hypothetical protein
MIVLSIGTLVTQTSVYIKGSSRNFRRALLGVLHSPYIFFLTHHSGVLYNRFSEDVETVDVRQTRNCLGFFALITSILASLIISTISLPYILIGLVPLAAAFV